MDGSDGAFQADLPTAATNHLGHGLAHLAVIDNASGIEKQAAEADDVRFTLAQLFGIQALDLHAIELGTGVQRFHALHFQRT